MAMTRLAPSRIGGTDRHLADGTAAPDRHGVGRLDVALDGALPARRKDVGQEEKLLVGNALRHLDVGRVGEGDAQIFGLPAGVAAGQMGVAEQARRRMAEGRVAERLVAVRALADREVAAPALLALAADDGEGHHDPVADLQRLVVLPDLDHLAHGLVAHDVACLHARHEVVVEVEIGAADGATRHFDDGVAPVLDDGIGNGIAADVRRAVPDECFHGCCPPRAPDRDRACRHNEWSLKAVQRRLCYLRRCDIGVRRTGETCRSRVR